MYVYILIYDTNISHTTSTDINGNFTINPLTGQYFYDGLYEVASILYP